MGKITKITQLGESWWAITTVAAVYTLHVWFRPRGWCLECGVRRHTSAPPLGVVAEFPQIPFDNHDAALTAARLFIEFGGGSG